MIPAPSAAPSRRPRRVVTYFLLPLFSLLVCTVIGEMALRLLFSDQFAEGHSKLRYRYDPRLGWFPVPNSQYSFTGARTIQVNHNSKGFRGPEYVSSDKPGIIFLGDSFVWGMDAELNERFTEKLQARHPEWNVFNFGVSGYGTDQDYLLLQQYFDQYHPRVVMLIFCTDNDDSDNCWNIRGGYYKPYCTLEGTRLKLEGLPVPRSAKVLWSEHPVLCRSWLARLFVSAYCKLTRPPPRKNPNPTGPLVRDLQKYVESKGAVFLVGLQHHHANLEEFLRYFNIPYVDLTTSLLYPSFGSHWTPEGHEFVCEKVENFLLQGNYLAQP